MKTSNEFTARFTHRDWKVRALSFLVIMTLVFGILMIAAEASPVSAASKTKVTLTINMGKNGSNCPTLYYFKGGKVWMGQAVSKWYIDGKLLKDPWDKFYSKGWDFSKHKVKVVMSIKVPKGKYKVQLDNGKKLKTLYKKLKVGSKTIKKKVKF
jgi:hypothetical protein